MTSIYIVIAYGGEWADKWEQNIKAFSSLEKAEAFCLYKQENIPEYSEYIERLTWKIGDFAHLAAKKKYDIVWDDTYWDEYTRVYDALITKMEKKYPHLTAEHDDCDVYYRADEVEYDQ